MKKNLGYNRWRFSQTPFLSAEVAKLVDAVDSKSTAFGCAGSSPAFGTIGKLIKLTVVIIVGLTK
ncbi:Conserved hypothetical protein [Candidatus Hamiltonella defensa (Bemisia tabaci)]|nr:Conserved hypothetical protein [Candidatus Hamiltonella defensa (Bemisia tabaci)]